MKRGGVKLSEAQKKRVDDLLESKIKKKDIDWGEKNIPKISTNLLKEDVDVAILSIYVSDKEIDFKLKTLAVQRWVITGKLGVRFEIYGEIIEEKIDEEVKIAG